MDLPAECVIKWLDTKAGQNWLNRKFKPLRYTHWASIKYDTEGQDCPSRWNPECVTVNIACGEATRPWVEPAVTDEIMIRPNPLLDRNRREAENVKHGYGCRPKLSPAEYYMIWD